MRKDEPTIAHLRVPQSEIQMPLVRHVRSFCEAHALHGRGLVGVSGGMDSVVLAHLLREAGREIELAHVNYGLRGAASDADQHVVEALADEWGVPLHRLAIRPDEVPAASRQAWARGVRYEAFARWAEARGLRWVAVAHHADDQAETVLLNLLRGTGVVGLGGMRPVRRLQPGLEVALVRPLLDVPRTAIFTYAQQHGLDWREDASNSDERYRRAWLRQQLMPLLRARFGEDVTARIAQTAALARERLVEPSQQRRAARQAVAFTDEGVRLDVLRALGPRARGRLLLDALERYLPGAPRTAAVAAQLAALVEAQVGRHVSFGAGTAWRERDHLRFVPAGEQGATGAKALHPGGRVGVGEGRVEASGICAVPGDPRTPPDACWLDAERLVWPLTVRRWQPGDRIVPFGMAGRKKVSDLLTDARWPASRRADALVVCSGAEIVWVVGVRAAENARITAETRQAVRLEYRRSFENP